MTNFELTRLLISFSRSGAGSCRCLDEIKVNQNHEKKTATQQKNSFALVLSFVPIYVILEILDWLKFIVGF